MMSILTGIFLLIWTLGTSHLTKWSPIFTLKLLPTAEGCCKSRVQGHCSALTPEQSYIIHRWRGQPPRHQCRLNLKDTMKHTGLHGTSDGDWTVIIIIIANQVYWAGSRCYMWNVITPLTAASEKVIWFLIISIFLICIFLEGKLNKKAGH